MRIASKESAEEGRDGQQEETPSHTPHMWVSGRKETVRFLAQHTLPLPTLVLEIYFIRHAGNLHLPSENV